MRMVILAAGQGQRLRPLTDARPKCLLEVGGKPLLEWQLESAWRLGMRDVAVVTGYREDQIGPRAIRRYHNPDYASTNMVETLWCAQAEFQGPLVVSYGDILYEDSVLQAVASAEAPIAVVVDLAWRPYWDRRFPDPLEDAESLRLDASGRIVEIGQRAATLQEIQGQYIGLMKFQGSGIEALRSTYVALKTRGVAGRGQRPFRTMYMTDLLQEMIDTGHELTAVPIHRKWLEIDSLRDYELANRSVQPGPSGMRITD
jgi:choline kinase